MPPNPTIILLHGAFADASGYAHIIRKLLPEGWRVRAPVNPLRGLAFDADALARYTKSIDGPILLVGHSYGGAVISEAAPAIKDVTGLVFLAAFGLDVGESCASLQEPFPPSLLASTAVASPYDAPGAAGGPDLFMKIADFHRTFCADLSEEVAGPMSVSQRPISAAALNEKATMAVETTPDLVHGLRAGQRHLAGGRTLHGQAHERPDDIGEWVARRVHRLRSELVCQLRDADKNFEVSVRVVTRIGAPIPDTDPQTSLQGDADAILCKIKQYSDAGVDRLVIEPVSTVVDDFLQQLVRFADEITPNVPTACPEDRFDPFRVGLDHLALGVG